MTSLIENPLSVFFDLEGRRLDDGYIYIGLENLNPKIIANQINVYWDEARTIPAAQPVRTVNGYMARNGTPARLYAANATVSMAIYNKQKRLVIYEPSVADRVAAIADTSDIAQGDALVGVKQPYAGAVATTQHNKNAETLSLAEFSTTQAAMDARPGIRHVPAGSYLGGTATNYVGFEMDKGASFSSPVIPLPFTAPAGSDNFLRSIRNTSKSGYDVYNAAYPSVTNFDVFQSVIEVGAGSTAENVTAVAGYVWQSDASPSNAVCLFGNGAVTASSGSCWGINTLLTDNASRVVGALTGVTLIGGEYDFNIMCPATVIIGISMGGNSLSQPTNAQAFIVNSLGTGIQWQTGFSTIDGAVNSTTGAALKIGSDAATGSNVASQRILMGWRDGAAAAQAAIIQASSGYINFNSSGTFLGVNLLGGDYSAPTGHGVIVNGNRVVTDRNTGWTPMTGAFDKATVYDTTTITLPQLAARFNTLQNALTQHGLIGA